MLSRFFILLFFFVSGLNGQNLVLNPGFESIRPFCKCWSEKPKMIEFSPANGAQNWEGIESPDLLNCNCTWFAQPLIQTVFGNSCMGMYAGHEFIYTRLNEKLKKDSLYKLSFYANTTLARMGDRYGKTFFDTLEACLAENKLPIRGNDQYSVEEGKKSADSLFYTRIKKYFTIKSIISPDSFGNWKKYSIVFRAKGNEEFLYIGKEVGNSRHFCYFAIDEVELVPQQNASDFTISRSNHLRIRPEESEGENSDSITVDHGKIFKERQVIDEDSAASVLQNHILKLVNDMNATLEVTINRNDFSGPSDYVLVKNEGTLIKKFLSNHTIEPQRVKIVTSKKQDIGNVITIKIIRS